MLSNYRALVRVLTVVVIAFGLTPSKGLSQKVVGLAGENTGLRLQIKAAGTTCHSGGPLRLRVDFRNVSPRPVRVAVGSPSELYFRFSVVRMESSNSAVPATLTSFGQERTDEMRSLGIRSGMVAPNDSVGEDFDIGPWYALPPGNYKIACYVDMPTTDSHDSTRLRYVSNELDVTVIP